ncbi:MAG: polysaccharide deacetylase family protein [Saprospiraceae bacterium]
MEIRPTVYLYCDQVTPRVTYTFQFIFEDVLQLSWQILDTLADLPTNGVLINYSSRKQFGGIYIEPNGLLSEHEIKNEALESIREVLNQIKSGQFDVDIFSFIFFSITRYEEYLIKERDNLGRFLYRNSILNDAKLGLHPFVDLTLRWLCQKMHESYPHIQVPCNMQYNFVSTVDVDQPWQYAHKGINNFLGILRDIISIKFREIGSRLNSILKPETDTFNQFDRIATIHKQYGIDKPIYFFLLGFRRNKLDRNHKPSNKKLIKLIQSLSVHHTIGLHPSYRSNKKTKFLQKEKAALEKILQVNAIYSRQHFILLDLPKTYRTLNEIGIKHDFSMGYPDCVGYRAGTGYNFFWYDLKNEQKTDLIIHPFTVMDVTLQKYMGLKPNEAIDFYYELVKTARQTGTPMTIIWHNNSLSDAGDWKGWDKVYSYLLKISK